MPLTPPQIAPLLDVILEVDSPIHGVGSDHYPHSGGTATGTWPAINKAIYIPLYIDRPGTVTKFWTLNGTTAAGNIDIGLYNQAYTRLSSKGSTAQAGTSVVQEFDVTDFAIVPGIYFLGIVASLTTTTFFFHTVNVVGYLQGMGITQEALGATTLPTTATPAAMTTTTFPMCGIAFRTLVA